MTDVRELKDTATQLATKGKLPAALEAWQRVTQAAPEDLAALQKVAELLVKVGKPAEAVAAWESVARRYAEKGLFFKASAACRIIVGLEPGHSRTQDYVAGLFARSKPAPKPVVAPAPAPVVPAPAPVTVAQVADVDVELDFEIDEVTPPTVSGLPSIPLFSMLGADELKAVLDTAMEVRTFTAGEVVVQEGTPGASMFALVEGEAGVFRGWGGAEQRRVASLPQGDIFGEVALVSKAPRVATVVADVDLVALEFRREAMAKVIKQHPRVGVMLDAFYRERLLANLMRASPILSALPEADQKVLSQRFKPRAFADGQRVIAEGQPPGAVYVLLRGVCLATHASGKRYPDLREGDLFGEVSVLTEGPATATVTTAGPVLTLELPGEQFKALVLANPAAAQALNVLAGERLTRTAKFDQADRRV